MAPAARGGFSLVDLLVSMAVIAVLIGLLMPGLASVRETARRVVCASNVRQHGLGIAMYADDSAGFLPPSKYAVSTQAEPHRMTLLRTDDVPEIWDGLGVLFITGYLEAPGIFYCPSHHGDHPMSVYVDRWNGAPGAIQANYQFRGGVGIRLDLVHDAQALVTDALRSQVDYSHHVGSNVLRADFTVGWFNDPAGSLAATLPAVEEGDPAAALKVTEAWRTIDRNLQLAR